MGSFNNITVSERNQRPSFNGRTILRAYFMRDGGYVPLDQFSVSSVMLFKETTNLSPSSVLDATTGLVPDTIASGAIWRWTLSGWEDYQNDPVNEPDPDFLTESNYSNTIGPSTSGIFTAGTGKLAVILDGTLDGSCLLRDMTPVGAASALSGEPAGSYIDVWTVKLCAGCEWTTFINNTSFFQNNAVILSEPLIFSTKERLYNKRLQLSSIENLKIGTEITIENKNIEESIRNVLKDGLISDAEIEIIKHNDSNPNKQAWETKLTFSNSAGLVNVTEDNTFLYLLDTTTYEPGTYTVQVKYSVLEETRRSPRMYFSIV